MVIHSTVKSNKTGLVVNRRQKTKEKGFQKENEEIDFIWNTNFHPGSTCMDWALDRSTEIHCQ